MSTRRMEGDGSVAYIHFLRGIFPYKQVLRHLPLNFETVLVRSESSSHHKFSFLLLVLNVEKIKRDMTSSCRL